jgi:hypothetical protein
MSTRVARLALFLLFFALYLMLGQRLGATGVFPHEDSIFQSDTWRTLGDLTEPGGDHYRTKVHPLFVLFFNFLGNRLLKTAGSHLLATALLIAAAGALCVAIAHVFFTALGHRPLAAFALSVLLGVSASHLLFASLPDTFIFTALSLTLCCWLAVGYPGSLPAFVPAVLFSLGITITNLGPSGLLFAASARGASGWAGGFRKSVALLLLVLLAAIGLSFAQKALYPSANLFFVPEAFQEDVGYTFVPHSAAQAWERGSSLLEHVALFSLVAPRPRIWTPQGSEVPWVTFQGQGIRAYDGIGRAALGLLLATYGLAAYGIVRRRLWREPILQGLVLAVAFLAVLHFFYGDDLFLYSCSWVGLVLGITACGLQGLARSGAKAISAVSAALVLLAMLTAVNNLRFLFDLIGLYGAP